MDRLRRMDCILEEIRMNNNIVSSVRLSMLLACLVLVLPLACKSSSQTVVSQEGASYQQGILAIEKADYPAAVGYLEKAVKEEPRNWSAFLRLGEAYGKMKDESNMKKAYGQVISLLGDKDISAVPPALALGKAHASLQDYHRAKYFYGQAAKLSPDNYDAYWGAGYCKYQIDMYQEALPDFQKCEELKPNNPEAMFYLARCTQKVEGGVNKNILSLYERSVEKGWRDSLVYLGDIYRQNDYPNRAIELYKKYVGMGGTLEKKTQDWFTEQENKSKQPMEVAVATKEVAQPQKEVLKVCPRCGRLGDRNARECEFDGEALSDVQ